MMSGDNMEVCDAYQLMTVEGQKENSSSNDENDEMLYIENVFFRGSDGNRRSTFYPDEPISVGVLVNPKENIVNPTIEIKLKSLTEVEILHVVEQVDASFSPNSREVIEFRIDRLPLTNDIVYVNVLLWNHDRTKLFARRSGNYSFRMVPKGHIQGQLSVNYEVRVGKYVENIRTQNS